jgi:hypothetical protein
MNPRMMALMAGAGTALQTGRNGVMIPMAQQAYAGLKAEDDTTKKRASVRDYLTKLGRTDLLPLVEGGAEDYALELAQGKTDAKWQSGGIVFNPATGQYEALQFSNQGDMKKHGLDGVMPASDRPESTIPGSDAWNEKQKAAKGAKNVSNTIRTGVTSVLKLDELGGMSDYDDSLPTRLWESAQQSDIGQFINKKASTEIGSWRFQMQALQPALLNAIKQAAEISGRGLDSNRELQFYIGQIGADDGDVVSNLTALHILDLTIGTGKGITDMIPEKHRKRVEERTTQAFTAGTMAEIKTTMDEKRASGEWSGDSVLGGGDPNAVPGPTQGGGGVGGTTSSGVKWTIE